MEHSIQFQACFTVDEAGFKREDTEDFILLSCCRLDRILTSHIAWARHSEVDFRKFGPPCGHDWNVLYFGDTEKAPPNTLWNQLMEHDLKELVIHPKIELRGIRTEDDWQIYLKHRVEIEEEWNRTHEEVIQIVEQIRLRQRALAERARWFFALENGLPVGAIGRVSFESEGKTFWRLQGVDIFPQWKTKGLGNRMLSSILEMGKQAGVEKVLLAALSNDWPKDWYARHGFVNCGKVGIVKI